MNKKVKKILSALMVIILMSCGSSQTDVAIPQLSAGISPTTASTNFGNASSAEEIKAMSAKLGSYFNGQYANNPKALMGTQAAANKGGSGLSATPMIASSNVASAVFRFFNTRTGAHFFTMSEVERDYVQNTFPFFTFEGKSFMAYPEADPTLSPVYRFYNNVTGTHFFTISADEKAYVQATWPTIFAFEGISWYASTSEIAGWVPVYRFFNTKTGAHFYTTSAVERDHVLATWNWFNFEGVAYYVQLAATPTSTGPLATAAQLDKFWERYGAKESFTSRYVEMLTKVLEAEDLVFAKDYVGARAIVLALIAKYPLMTNESGYSVWWDNYWESKNKSTLDPPHFGEPGIYAQLRMLDDITKMGVEKKLLPGTTPIQMAIVIPQCSNIRPKTGPTLLNERISPEIKENSYEAVRQSLRLFQSYLLAISGGVLRLELNFYELNTCLEININNTYTLDATPPLMQLPAGVLEKSDMFWLLYPMDFNAGIDYGFSSGIGGYDNKPVFISEDDWILKKKAGQGTGFRTEVERRMYLPEWFQHEVFHHFFSSWPEFELEKTQHQWLFDKNSWPSDFTGQVEEDYFSEALNKRLYGATPSIAKKLQRASKP